MKTFITALTILVFSSNISAQKLISATLIKNRSVSQINYTLNQVGWNTSSMSINSVNSYKIIYNTVDVHGNPTIASGALFVPQGLCDTLPLVSYHHGTEFDRDYVPSNNGFYYIGLLFSGNGYITTMPDYLGMGENQGNHPYLHWESEATASLDLIRAAREYLVDSLSKRDNNQLFLSGYSQGGHATMATHKYITVNNLQNEFNVIASAPLSAPIDLSKSQFNLMFDDDSTYYRSAFLPYIASSYQLVYGNLYNNLNEYFISPYDTIIENYLSAGTYSNVQWSIAIPFNLYDFVQDTLLYNLRNNSNHPFMNDVKQNDLYNWIAYEPIRLYYCGMDSMVTPLNSIIAADTMMKTGSADVTAININSTGTHESCYIPCISYAFNWFDSLSVSCEIVNSVESDLDYDKITFFPNPVNNILTCNSNQIKSIYIYDLLGKLVLSSECNSINMSNLDKGVYLVKAINLSSEIVSVQKIIRN